MNAITIEKVHRLTLGAILVILNVWDVIVTRMLLSRGLAEEANPLMVNLVETWWGIAIKVIVPTIAVFYALRIEAHRKAMIGLLVVVWFYATVVAWNTGLLLG